MLISNSKHRMYVIKKWFSNRRESIFRSNKFGKQKENRKERFENRWKIINNRFYWDWEGRYFGDLQRPFRFSVYDSGIKGEWEGIQII